MSKSAYLTEWYNQQYWDPYRTRKLLRFSVSIEMIEKQRTVCNFVLRHEYGIEEQLIFCQNRLETNGNGMHVMHIITQWKTLLIMISSGIGCTIVRDLFR